MSTVRYIEEDQIPGPGGRWIAAPPPPPPPEINPAMAATATAVGTTTAAAATPTPLLLFRAYRRSFPGQPHRQHDSYVWIEVVDSSSPALLLEPLRKTFPTLGTLYDPKPAVRFSFFLFQRCGTTRKTKEAITREREREGGGSDPPFLFCWQLIRLSPD